MVEIQKAAKAVFAALVFAGLQILVITPVQADQGDTVRLSVEGLSASLGEDEPRVLYILPWQAPSLPRRPREDLNDEAPELVRPADPSRGAAVRKGGAPPAPARAPLAPPAP